MRTGMADRANLHSGKSCDNQCNEVKVKWLSTVDSWTSSVAYISAEFSFILPLLCSYSCCYSAGILRWRSSLRLTLERPSRVSTSPSIKPHSEWVWNTRARISRCPTCQWRPQRLTRTDGWPTISPGRPACPRTTWPGPCATSPTEKQLQTMESWWVTFLALKTQS